MHNYKHWISIFILTISFLSFAQTDESKLKISGWGFLTYGKIINSSVQTGKDFDLKGQNYCDFDAGLKGVFNLGEHTKGRLHFGFSTAFMANDNENKNVEMKRRRLVPYLIDAAVEYTLSSGKNTFFTEFGWLPIKYNPESRNLGEYLFRSNCYPNVVVSGFEAPGEKLVGWHGMYKNDLSEKSWLKGDVYCNVELGLYPIYDFSLSYILSANFAKFIELGAGMYHQHLISVDDNKLTPGVDTASYPRDLPGEFRLVGHPGKNGDTILYTFKGTKAMGRVTLDPKAFFDVPIFGSEDLKIYAELGILGLKDYPYWYANIKERMPLMFGINIPTFKVLDVLSVEGQYWRYPWWNSAENIWKYGSPVPYVGDLANDGAIPFFEQADTLRKHNDDWRWSVYASRKIKNRIRISLQFASDNMNKTSWSPPPPSYSKYTEILPRSKDWYWVSRITFYM